ncbi:MAG: cobalt-precorrin-6A reductase [Rhodospirillaceae bacterium]|nr:cobalt-precorrin-6A reductase [Rhodospirillaceae bacterium]
MTNRKRTLLILGGTGDALHLARATEEKWGSELRVIYSLAGVTHNPARTVGEVRVGGFGGDEGLARYLRDQKIDFLIDSTHPFSTQISRHAALAAAATGTPRCALLRPPWQAEAGDHWHEVVDMAAAAMLVPKLGSRIFLSVGTRSLQFFSELREIWCLVRLITPLETPIPLLRAKFVMGRGPFDTASERRLLEQHRIDLVVTKASGGEATRGKIDAARTLGLPVVMVRRPDPPPGEAVGSTDAALSWLMKELKS